MSGLQWQCHQDSCQHIGLPWEWNIKPHACNKGTLPTKLSLGPQEYSFLHVGWDDWSCGIFSITTDSKNVLFSYSVPGSIGGTWCRCHFIRRFMSTMIAATAVRTFVPPWASTSRRRNVLLSIPRARQHIAAVPLPHTARSQQPSANCPQPPTSRPPGPQRPPSSLQSIRRQPPHMTMAIPMGMSKEVLWMILPYHCLDFSFYISVYFIFYFFNLIFEGLRFTILLIDIFHAYIIPIPHPSPKSLLPSISLPRTPFNFLSFHVAQKSFVLDSRKFKPAAALCSTSDRNETYVFLVPATVYLSFAQSFTGTLATLSWIDNGDISRSRKGFAFQKVLH